MAENEIELHPVDRITTDALGMPGKRVFYIQGSQGEQTITLILEKAQVQALAVGVEEFLAELHQRFPNLPRPSNIYQEAEMRITPPVDPLFRIGELHLGYHMESDLVVLIARENLSDAAAPLEPGDPPKVSTVRFWCTCSQLRSLATWGLEVVSRGRTTCPLCGELISPQEGHVCVKRNGKKHGKIVEE